MIHNKTLNHLSVKSTAANFPQSNVKDGQMATRTISKKVFLFYFFS